MGETRTPRRRGASATEALESALRAYDGALLVASHDAAFLEAIGVERQAGLAREAQTQPRPAGRAWALLHRSRAPRRGAAASHGASPMRPPRYRFPDEVRSTARAMAARMVEDGSLPETDEALDAWIAARPEVREPLERGGYGPKFGAGDLLPLVHVFAGAAGGAGPRTADAPAKTGPGRWIALAVAAVAAIVLGALLVGCAPGGRAAATEAAAVTVRYEHLRSCTRFMGQQGRYLVYRIVDVDNGAPAPFTLHPSRLRFPDGSAPALAVPEFSDREAAPGERAAYDEHYLLRMEGDGPPPRGAVPLGYDDPAVALVRGGAEPAEDDPDACNAFAT